MIKPTKLFLRVITVVIAQISILHAQNVGIGTSVPLDKLHVNGGTIRVSNLAGVGNRTVLADNFGRLIVASGANSPDWTILGNLGTNSNVNFLGTTDNQSLVIRTNNLERARVMNTGQVLVNAIAPVDLLDMFEVVGNSTYPFAVNGYGSGGGAGVYGENLTGGTGVFGISSLYGVFGQGGNIGVYAWDSLAVAASSGYALYATNRHSSGLGIFGIGNGVVGSYPNLGAGISGTGSYYGIYALARRNSNGIGVIGVGNNLGTFTVIGRGSGISGTGSSFGASGFATTAGTAALPTAGGYFEVAIVNPPFAYVGAYGGLNYKIIGSGTVSTIVKDANDKDVVMFAPEAPEVLFMDYGTSTLVNGEATITLDPSYSKNIFVSESSPLKVIIQPEGDCNGVFVYEKTQSGFKVKELNNGTSNINFTYQVVARRADEINSPYGQQRFPEAPGRQESKSQMVKSSDNISIPMQKEKKE
ncbi:MAG TPA: hypothetical protein PKH65_06320 [Bacteroidia bacterium]|nr:hypothetical protein [Bacteroidia bacterium]HNT80281.1 hypothetical protein [Bacteroidia bacterium]